MQPKQGCQINSYIRSVNVLSSVLDYGYFSENVFVLLADPISRNLAKVSLVETYFPHKKEGFLKAKRTGQGFFNNLENYLLNEPDVPYHIQKAESEEDLFVRGGLFKKIVPKVYESTCCITGMRIESTFGHTFIDACHIVPFAISHNDKINNGIALCPNLHRAFDRGLIGITKDYRVLISQHMIEGVNHPYNLSQLKDMEIRLPVEQRHFPDLDSLKWHREHIFKG